MNFLNEHRKEAITIAGVLLFMIAGGLAMLIIPSENAPQQTQSRNTNQQATQQTQQTQQVQTQNTNYQAQSQNDQPTNPNIPAKNIYVYMTGAVKKPGVYKFPEGSRIFEVVEAAGGFTDKADIAALNLAETFSDAQHIHIPAKGEIPRTTANNADTYTHVTIQPSSTNAQTSKRNVNQQNQFQVDINHASESELQRLIGVGPAIARRILDYRQQHGRFNSPEDLLNVRGIGAAKLEKMRSQILIR